jgi:hypothetical protein
LDGNEELDGVLDEGTHASPSTVTPHADQIRV